MSKPYNPYAIPETGPEQLPKSTRQWSIEDFIAIVVATVIMSGMSFGAVIVVLSGAVMAVEQAFALRLDLLWPGVLIVSLIVATIVTIQFARRAAVAIRQPTARDVNDDETQR